MTFLVVLLNTQAKTAKLTTPTLQPSPPSNNFVKLDFLLCLGVHLYTTYPINYAQFFSRSVGVRAPSAPPGYAYATKLLATKRKYTKANKLVLQVKK